MKNNMQKETICVVIIRGKSAEDMWLAGAEDLEDYFFPEKMGLKSEEVEIKFVEKDLGDKKKIYIDISETEEKTIRDTKRIAGNT